MIFVLTIIAVGTVYAVQSPFYALLFYLWNAYFRPEVWTYGGGLYALRLSLVIGVYLVIATAVTMPRFNLNLRSGLILLFFGQCVVGTLTSESPELSASFLGTFWKVLLVSYLMVVLVTDERRFRIALMVIGISLGFELAKQGWADLYRAPGRVNNNPIPFLGDNNGVALGAMMLVPILTSLAQTAQARWEKYFWRFIAIGVLLRGLSTYSRGGFLSAAVVGLATFARSERKVRALIGVAIVGTAVTMYMPQDFWNRMSTIRVEEGGEREESSAGRIHFWGVAMVMAEAKPLTGVGLNNFVRSYETYNVDGLFAGQRAAHSSWFGVLGDLGVPGLAIFAGLWLTSLFSCWQVSRAGLKDPGKRNLRLFANGLLTSLLAFGVGGSFLSSHYNEMVWHFFGLSTALYVIAFQPAVAVAPAPRQQVQVPVLHGPLATIKRR
jgi:probable O-glycosylation ligase (exosortase A-associated)